MNVLKDYISRLKCLINGVTYTKGIWIHPISRLLRINEGCICLGKNIEIHKDCSIECDKGNLIIGDGCNFNVRTRIEAYNNIRIENNVLTGPNVYISDKNHEYRDKSKPISSQGFFSPGGILIGEGSWIGINSVILGNVNIGKHCVIGANSVVTKDIPDYSVAVGVPAKVIKSI